MRLGKEIILRLYLIFDDGSKDSILTEAKCSLKERVKLKNVQAQANFICNKTNFKKIDSLKRNNN